MDNVAAFNLEVARAGRNLPDQGIVKLHKFCAFTAAGRVIRFRTPVDTGRTRGAWIATNNAPDESPPPFSPDKGGTEALRRAQQSIDRIRPYESWWLTNNMAHILVLELGGFVPPDPGPSKDPRRDRHGRTLVVAGFSAQAPHGMVAPVLDELRLMLSEA